MIYNAAKFRPSLIPGMSDFFFNAESGLNGGNVKSESFGVAREGGKQTDIGIEVSFAADPGAFQIDIQEADTDVEANYQVIPSAGTVNSVDAAFHTRVDLTPFVGRFIRLNVVSLTNNVALTARVTRQ